MNPIRKALENLPGRWHKGSLTDRRGNYCGIGHVLCAAQQLGITDTNPLGDLLNEVAHEQFPDRTQRAPWSNGPTFADFNDCGDTTEEEVIMVMEKAAIKWEEING